jgi:hypothetical protein
MTTGEMRDHEGRCGRDPLRQVTLGLLALYLSPVVLVVLLIGGLGMACCAALRLVGIGCDRGPAEGVIGHAGAVRGIAVPHHLYGAASSRSHG